MLRRRAGAVALDGRGGIAPRPRLGVAVVACMDSRIDVFRIFGLEAGDAHVIRNAGGVITDDVIRSLALSQRLLGTTEVVLVHHTGCGMLTFRDEELAEQIEAETGHRPPFALEAFADVDEDVRRSIARIEASPFVLHKRIRGFVYDVDEGSLREVGSLSV